MKIIYDTEQPMHRRVQFVGNNGKTIAVPSYDIKIELEGVVAEYSRWGDAKIRKGHREAVAKALAEEAVKL